MSRKNIFMTGLMLFVMITATAAEPKYKKWMSKISEVHDEMYGPYLGVLECVNDRNVVGYLHYEKPGPEEDVIHIVLLEVAAIAPKELLRKGIGEALVRWLFEHVIPGYKTKRHTINKVTLSVLDVDENKINVEAEGLYLNKLGFTYDDPTHKHKNYDMTKKVATYQTG